MATARSRTESIASLQNKIGQLEKAIILLATWTNLDLSHLNDLGIIQEQKEGEQDPLGVCADEPCSSLSTSTSARSFNRLARKSTGGLSNRIKNIRNANLSRRTVPLRLTLVTPETAFNSEDSINSIKEETTLPATDFDNDENDDPEYMPLPLPINGCTSSDDSDNDNPFDDGGMDAEFNINGDSSSEDGSENEDNDSSGIGIVDVKSLAGIQVLSPTDPNRPSPYVRLDKLTADFLETQYNVKLRKQKVTTQRTYPQFCKTCDNVELKSHKELLKHRRNMHKKQKQVYKCDVCDSDVTFKRKKKYLQHMKKHTERKRKRKMYTCEICHNYTSDHKSRVADHTRIHTNERPFLCYVCAATFKTLSTLNTHLKIHRDDIQKNFKCSDCDKAFERKLMLITHQKKMHMIDNDLKMECSICKIVLADKDKYKRHISAVHEEVRKFSCPLCGQAFKRSTHLKVHIIRHSNPKRRKRGPQRSILYRRKDISESDAAMKTVESENKDPEPSDSDPSTSNLELPATQRVESENKDPEPSDADPSTSNIELSATQATSIANLSPSLQVEIDSNQSTTVSESKISLGEEADTVMQISPHHNTVESMPFMNSVKTSPPKKAKVVPKNCFQFF